MKKNELNKNVILNEDAVKNIHCDEITAVINSNDSPKAMMNKLDDYHGSDMARGNKYVFCSQQKEILSCVQS